MEEVSNPKHVEPQRLVIAQEQILWRSGGFVIFRDHEGRLQCYMPEFKKMWPFEVYVSTSEPWEDL